MNNLKVIENDLVPVYETEKGIKVVYGSELHEVLGVKSKFADWIKKRLEDCESVEYEDFESFSKNLENGGRTKEYILKLDTAKEMAMLERNETGRQVRKYFIAIEKKYNQNMFDMAQLSPDLQMFNRIFQSVAKQEIEQKRQAEKIEKIENTQTAIIDTFQKVDDIENFQKWVNSCISKIAKSPKFTSGSNISMKYSIARSESYERLMKKRSCRLNDRVQRAKGRALEERPDIKKSELDKINKLYIISNDKDLKTAYELVIKEMMVFYCVKTA